MPNPALPQYLTTQVQLWAVPFPTFRAPALDYLMLYHLQWRQHRQVDHFATTRNTLPAQLVVAVWAVLQCVLTYLRQRRFLPRRILFGCPFLARFVGLLALLFMRVGFYGKRRAAILML